jgi:hypothetical protein
MAITAFIDPFGSMVQGYKEGQQAEIQRQSAKRDFRDSDYNYNLRQIRDPMITKDLQTTIDKNLYEYLRRKIDAPIETKMNRERLTALSSANEFEELTRPFRYEVAKLDPTAAQAAIDAQKSNISRNEVLNRISNLQGDQLQKELELFNFAANPAMQNYDNAIPLLTLRYMNAGIDKDSARILAESHWRSVKGTDPSSMIQSRTTGDWFMQPEDNSVQQRQEAVDMTDAYKKSYEKIFGDLYSRNPFADPAALAESARKAAIAEIISKNPNVKFNITDGPVGGVTMPGSARNTQDPSAGAPSAQNLRGVFQ